MLCFLAQSFFGGGVHTQELQKCTREIINNGVVQWSKRGIEEYREQRKEDLLIRLLSASRFS